MKISFESPSLIISWQKKGGKLLFPRRWPRARHVSRTEARGQSTVTVPARGRAKGTRTFSRKSTCPPFGGTADVLGPTRDAARSPLQPLQADPARPALARRDGGVAVARVGGPGGRARKGAGRGRGSAGCSGRTGCRRSAGRWPRSRPHWPCSICAAPSPIRSRHGPTRRA